MIRKRDYNPNRDIEVVSPPTDGISSLSFSSKANLLVASSWDKQVRCWEVHQNRTTTLKSSITHDSVLCTAWNGVSYIYHRL